MQQADLNALDKFSQYEPFRDSVIPNYPPEIQAGLVDEYAAFAKRGEWGAANDRLAERDTELTDAHVSIAFDADSIASKAKGCALACLRFGDLERMLRVCKRQGIAAPDPDQYSEAGCMARMRCAKWWRRRLHVQYSRRAEGTMRELGLIHKIGGLYCSDATLERRKAQKARQREMLREVAVVNDQGEQFTLFELAEKGQANPALRRAELMTRCRGFEEVARAAGHVAELLTFTTPSRFHAYDEFGKPNRKHEAGLSPRDAQAWLCDNWSRIRAKLARLSIRVYGFRVAEPHHDATTHWHLLLFMARHNRQIVRDVCAGYLLRDSGKEWGARKHRFDAKAIDNAPGRGRTATAYLAKYISKNIDGFAVGADHENPDFNASETAQRVDAWASTWGIRQFQQIGGPAVGIWRELRRIREPVDGAELEAARAAADAGEWQKFIEALGGIEAGRRGSVELAKEWSDKPNEYGDAKGFAVFGVKCGALLVLTRQRIWIFLSAISAPWTRVNNCTDAYDEWAACNASTGPPDT